jgi:hypothetical protein
MTVDPRLLWMASNVAVHFPQSKSADDVVAQLLKSDNVDVVSSFLDGTSLIVVVSFVQNTALISATTDVASASSGLKVVFVKRSSLPIQSETLSKQVIVSTILENSKKSLFYVLRNVYLPLLSSDRRSSTDSNLNALLRQLDASLAANSITSSIDDIDDISGIASVADEV